MAKQTINIGSAANDGTGSTLREAFDITNDNFTELYGGTGGLFHKIEGTNFTGSLLIGHTTTGTLSSALNNTGVGIGALDALTSGDDNVVFGTNAATALTTGSSNVAIGHVALASETGGSRNVAIGQGTLNALTHGGQAYNVAVGYQAGVAVSSGAQNTLVGGQAGESLTTGSFNIAIGKSALNTEDTGSGNVGIGRNALNSADYDGSAYNLAVGYNSGYSISTGVQNVILGSLSGDALTTGSNNIVIGYGAAASAVDVSNEVTIGNSSISNVRIPSDSTLKIGASGDLQLEHLSGHSFIKNTDTGDLYIENQVDNGNVIFRSDNGSGGLATYFRLDGNQADGTHRYIDFPDNSVISLGDNDAAIYHDGTDTRIKNETGDLFISQFANDKDIIFKSDNGSGGVATYLTIDGSLTQMWADKDLQFSDNIKAKFGASSDLQIYHNATNTYISNSTGDLYIEQLKNDGDIIFKSDDGSGGTAEYFRLDGGATKTTINKEMQFFDTIIASFGNAADLQIYHDGNNSFIQDQGTGNLYIDATSQIIFRDYGSAEEMAKFINDGAVELYHDNSKKFETTSAGVTVTGKVTANTGGGYDSIKIASNFTADANKQAGITTENYAGNSVSIMQYATHETANTVYYGSADGAHSGIQNHRFYVNTGVNTPGSGHTQALHIGSDTNATFAGSIYVPQYLIHEGDGNTYLEFAGGDNIKLVAGGKQYFHAHDNGNLYLSSNNSTTITLDTSQNATFAGTITTTGTLTANTGHVNIDSGYSFQWGDTHERIEQSDGKIEFFANNTQQMTLSGANLGIGTDSPGALLHLANTSGGPIYLEDTDATDTFDITSISNGGGNFSLDTRRTSDNGFVSTDYQIVKDASGANYHRWLTANTERMRVNASGDILFGTTSETNSHAYFSAESNSRMVLSLGAATTSASTIASFKNSNGAVGSISVDGSATAFNTSSDYRLKEDLKDFDGLDKVSKIPVYDFKWKVDDSRSYGVLAHELQEVVPNAVNGEKDAEEMQGVDYSKIVPLLIKSIQELEARVKTLENK